MSISLREQANAVQTREDFITWVYALVNDLNEHPERWENNSIALYLAAAARWIADSHGYYLNTGQAGPTSTHLTWKHLADILMAARYYE